MQMEFRERLAIICEGRPHTNEDYEATLRCLQKEFYCVISGIRHAQWKLP
jgi:hypothetical protein